jgi:anti-sigma B factor antagonist
MTRAFRLDLRFVGNGCAVLTVAGDPDPATAPRLREQDQALLAGGPLRLLLDLSAVDFCDSSGLGAVLGLWHQATAGKSSLGDRCDLRVTRRDRAGPCR